MGIMEMANVKETWFEDREEHFGDIEGLRVLGRTFCPLMDILMLGFCAIIRMTR